MRNGKYAGKRRSVFGTKGLTLVLALMLVVGCVVGGTLAWLTAESSEVTNTFTTSDIKVELSETKGNSFKIVPGATSEKDPTAKVTKGSEKCYLYVKITNNLVIGSDTVASYNINTTDWILVGESGNTKLYRYKDVVDASSEDVSKAVFTTVTYDGEKITKSNIEQLKDKTIVLKAYAHQSENTTVDVANTAANTWAGTTAISGN